MSFKKFVKPTHVNSRTPFTADDNEAQLLTDTTYGRGENLPHDPSCLARKPKVQAQASLLKPMQTMLSAHSANVVQASCSALPAHSERQGHSRTEHYTGVLLFLACTQQETETFT